jgi:uncharacterized LabA/DUF88 family protein
LIAGDSDFIPAIRAAKNEGVLIHLFHGATPHQKLIEISDERTRLTSDFISDLRWNG